MNGVLPAGRPNPWVVIAFICIPVFVGSLDLTVVSAFLPELIIQLNLNPQTSLGDASWIVSGYLLAYTISLTFTGRLSDLVGRRAVYVACLLLFIAGSVLVALAHTWPTDLLLALHRSGGGRPDPAVVNLQAIIIGRVVQALGAGALVPVSLALAGDLFPPQMRARPLGLVAAVDTLGWVLGSLYGGLFVQFMPWQGLFWINVPLTLLALGATLWALRGVPQMRAGGRFDLLGTGLIVGALSCLNLGLGANIEISGRTGSFEELSPLPEYAAPVLLLGLVFLLAFIFVERRVRDPLINLAMFRRRSLTAGAVANLFIGFCLFIGLVNVPLLINIRGEADVSSLQQTALHVGLLLSTMTLPMAAAAVPGGWLSERIGLRSTTLLGLALAGVGFGLMWQTWTVDIPEGAIALQMALIGVGIGLTFSPVSTAIINSARTAERGVASALVIILRLLGMTVSVSSLSTLGVYRVNQLVNMAAAELDTQAYIAQYTDLVVSTTVQVLAEMGLIGLVMCALAALPTLFMAQRVMPPDEEPEKAGMPAGELH